VTKAPIPPNKGLTRNLIEASPYVHILNINVHISPAI
jgi:hypothetical protein